MFVAVMAAGAAWSAQPVDETLQVASDATIEVDNLAGKLVFQGWGQNAVEVKGVLGDGVERLDIEEEEDGLYIEVVWDEEFHGRQQTDTDLTIMVPENASLDVETVSASISVEGVFGEVELETVSGAVVVSGAPSTLDVENVSGKISVENAPPGTNLESVSGLIEVQSVSGRFDADNVSGSIAIRGGSLAGADMETVSGNITCHAVPGMDGDVDIETMSGMIELIVDAGGSASYELSTFSGSINNDIGPEPRRTSKYTPGKELSFNTGPGGPRISLNSFSGTIKLMTR
jgi:hypothetical protein